MLDKARWEAAESKPQKTNRTGLMGQISWSNAQSIFWRGAVWDIMVWLVFI